MRKFVIFLLILFCLTTLATHISAQSITSEDDVSWYMTQWGTGLGQCGPTCVAMLIQRNGPNVTPEMVRAQLKPGPADGATGYDELLEILASYGIYYTWLQGMSEWTGDGVLMVKVNPILIPEAPYEYDGGHYILIVGQTETHYIVNDPLIGSPIRYYSKEDVNAARYRYIILIP